MPHASAQHPRTPAEAEQDAESRQGRGDAALAAPRARAEPGGSIWRSAWQPLRKATSAANAQPGRKRAAPFFKGRDLGLINL